MNIEQINITNNQAIKIKGDWVIKCMHNNFESHVSERGDYKFIDFRLYTIDNGNLSSSYIEIINNKVILHVYNLEDFDLFGSFYNEITEQYKEM